MSEEVKRTCCQIVDNMCKLVEDPAEVLPLMPRLEPLVKSATEKIADPEARGVAERALKTLQKAAGDGAEVSRRVGVAEALAAIQAALAGAEVHETMLTHVAGLVAAATNMRSFGVEAWKADVGYE